MEVDFSSTVMRYFGYLVKDYDFRVEKIDISDRAPLTEGRIDFVCPTTFVVVSSEQSTAGAVVGRIQDDRYRYFLNPLTIRKYHALTESDKGVLYSLNPRDDAKAKIINRATRITPLKNPSESTLDYIVTQLSNYSKWLRQYAEPFLRGDFAQWLEIYEFSVLSSRAAHIRAGKSEYVRTTSADVDNRISIFQNRFDYLERLRAEHRSR